MGETWLLADPHLGHANLAKFRGYATTERHDAHLLSNLRRVLQPSSTCWWLGDIAFGNWRENLLPISDLPGTHHLILGNHDRAHPLNKNGHLYQRDYLKVFESVSLAAKLNYKGYHFMLSHFPYQTDHTPQARYLKWRLRDEGAPLIHGHTHSPERLSTSANGSPQYHVGLDATDMKPVRVSDLLRA